MAIKLLKNNISEFESNEIMRRAYPVTKIARR